MCQISFWIGFGKICKGYKIFSVVLLYTTNTLCHKKHLSNSPSQALNQGCVLHVILPIPFFKIVKYYSKSIFFYCCLWILKRLKMLSLCISYFDFLSDEWACHFSTAILVFCFSMGIISWYSSPRSTVSLSIVSVTMVNCGLKILNGKFQK